MQDKRLCTGILLAGLFLSNTVFAAEGLVQWGYDSDSPQGPSHWGDLTAEFTACKSGKNQSPIDINDSKAVKLTGIKFNYKPTPIDVINNGHTIQVNYAQGSSIDFGGKVYKLLQFHFHSPSEHTVKGNAYDMVAHLVHQADDGQLGVIGVLLKQGKNSNPAIETVWKHMPSKAGERNTIPGTLNARDLLPTSKRYYNYSGSLTTPPCSEGVNWMVMQTPVEVSVEQIVSFRNLFPLSTRPVQTLNGRTVHTSK